MGSERSPFLDRIRLQLLGVATGFVPNLSIKYFYLGELSYRYKVYIGLKNPKSYPAATGIGQSTRQTEMIPIEGEATTRMIRGTGRLKTDM